MYKFGSGAASIAFFLLVCSAGGSWADAIPSVYSTGVDNNHSVLAGGIVDFHYTLISSADPSFPGPATRIVLDGTTVAPSGPWLANNSASKWISPRPDGDFEPAGNYTYRTTFNLTGFNPATAVLNGNWTLDDHGLDILINGQSTGYSRPDFGAHTSFQPFIISSGFVPGTNTLDFIVSNSFNQTGLRVEMVGTAVAVPEPSSLLLLGLGAIGAGGYERVLPKRRKLRTAF